jgi:hypothetical protein
MVGIEPNQNINEESLTYTLELTTPHQAGDYVLEARVYYQKEDEWYYNEQEYLKQFNINTVQKTEPEPEPSPEPSPSPEPTPEPKPRGIPGFPLESIALGLATYTYLFISKSVWGSLFYQFFIGASCARVRNNVIH